MGAQGCTFVYDPVQCPCEGGPATRLHGTGRVYNCECRTMVILLNAQVSHQHTKMSVYVQMLDVCHARGRRAEMKTVTGLLGAFVFFSILYFKFSTNVKHV